MSETAPEHWRDHGIRIVTSAALDLNTPQTPGMTRAAAITHARTGASKLWAGTVTIHPERQDRRPSSRRGGERHFRGERTRPHALGRSTRIRGRSRTR